MPNGTTVFATLIGPVAYTSGCRREWIRRSSVSFRWTRIPEGSGNRRDELVPPVLGGSVVVEHVEAAVDLDLEGRRIPDRPTDGRPALAPQEHALTGHH
jgi:hypothetical protein